MAEVDSTVPDGDLQDRIDLAEALRLYYNGALAGKADDDLFWHIWERLGLFVAKVRVCRDSLQELFHGDELNRKPRQFRNTINHLRMRLAQLVIDLEEVRGLAIALAVEVDLDALADTSFAGLLALAKIVKQVRSTGSSLRHLFFACPDWAEKRGRFYKVIHPLRSLAGWIEWSTRPSWMRDFREELAALQGKYENLAGWIDGLGELDPVSIMSSSVLREAKARYSP